MGAKFWAWTGGAVAVAAFGGLAVLHFGLDRSDKLASIAGVFIGLAGLAVAVVGLVAAQRSPGDQDVTVGGSFTDYQNVKGKLTIRRKAPPAPLAGPVSGGSRRWGRQTRVAGHYDRADGVDGDVEITEQP
ncbi:hypothetical protein [Streptomyces sp. NPDC051219]|uniref:hypothetical protein n=1 Tax=Streptomyces sp. NPDC051219 TaxID=3155283 RepID=UPI00344AAA64